METSKNPLAAKSSRFYAEKQPIETNFSSINTISFKHMTKQRFIYLCAKFNYKILELRDEYQRQEFPYESINSEINVKTKSDYINKIASIGKMSFSLRIKIPVDVI